MTSIGFDFDRLHIKLKRKIKNGFLRISKSELSSIIDNIHWHHNSGKPLFATPAGNAVLITDVIKICLEIELIRETESSDYQINREMIYECSTNRF